MIASLAELTEKELARRALNGQQQCYGELMRRYREAIYRLVRTHVGDADEALDVTQEAFVSAFAALSRFDGERPFRVWLSRIAINKCHDWARRRAVRRFFAFAKPIEAAMHVADHAATPEDNAATSDDKDRLIAAIAKLPPKLKETLVLRTIEEFSQAEVAQTLNISEKAVEMRLYRARAKLSEFLRD